MKKRTATFAGMAGSIPLVAVPSLGGAIASGAADRPAPAVEHASPLAQLQAEGIQLEEAEAVATAVSERDSLVLAAASQTTEFGSLSAIASSSLTFTGPYGTSSLDGYDGTEPMSEGQMFGSVGDVFEHANTAVEVVSATVDPQTDERYVYAKVLRELNYVGRTIVGPDGNAVSTFGEVIGLHITFQTSNEGYVITNIDRGPFEDPEAVADVEPTPEEIAEDTVDPSEFPPEILLEESPPGADGPPPDGPVEGASIAVPAAVDQRALRPWVAQWAYAYAYSTHPAWPRYRSDCTNFVSQALYYGGWNMHGSLNYWDIRDTNKWRFSSTNSKTHTWSVADYLHTYVWRDGPGLTGIRYYDQVRIGDIAFVNIDRNGGIDHAMVATAFDVKAKEPFFSYHTTDTRNISLAAFIKRAGGNPAIYGYWVRQ